VAQQQFRERKDGRWVGVALQGGKSGWFRICFDENDVRRACGMMLCGDHSENCISLMKKGRMTCELCHSVLKALRKQPEQVRVSQGPFAGTPPPAG
jgi:hypothetical protein